MTFTREKSDGDVIHGSLSLLSNGRNLATLNPNAAGSGACAASDGVHVDRTDANAASHGDILGRALFNVSPTSMHAGATGAPAVASGDNPAGSGVNPVASGVNPVASGVNPAGSAITPAKTGVIPVFWGYGPQDDGVGTHSPVELLPLREE